MDQESSAAAIADGKPQLGVQHRCSRTAPSSGRGVKGTTRTLVDNVECDLADSEANRQKDNKCEPLNIEAPSDATPVETQIVAQPSFAKRNDRSKMNFPTMNDFSENITTSMATAAAENRSNISEIIELMKVQQQAATFAQQQQATFMAALMQMQVPHSAAPSSSSVLAPGTPGTPSILTMPSLPLQSGTHVHDSINDTLYHMDGRVAVPGAATEAAAAAAAAAAHTNPALSPAPPFPPAVPGFRREMIRETLSVSHVHKLDM